MSIQADSSRRNMLDFQTETAGHLHATLNGIVSCEMGHKELFDIFLQLMIRRCAGQEPKHMPRGQGTISSLDSATMDSLCDAAVFCTRGILREEVDVLGDYYEQAGFGCKSRGQTLTPQALADAVARQTIGPMRAQATLNICDPCCGSGRFLLAAGRYAPNATLYGVDIDRSMARMSAINVTLFGLRGLVVCADVFDFAPGSLDQTNYVCAYEIGKDVAGTLRVITPGVKTITSE